MDVIEFTNCNKYRLEFSDKPGKFLDDSDKEITEILKIPIYAKASWKMAILKAMEAQCEENVSYSLIENYLQDNLPKLPKSEDTWYEPEVEYRFYTKPSYSFHDIEILDSKHAAITLIANVKYIANDEDNDDEVLNYAEIQVRVIFTPRYIH
jgi:hypothetical protein